MDFLVYDYSTFMERLVVQVNNHPCLSNIVNSISGVSLITDNLDCVIRSWQWKSCGSRRKTWQCRKYRSAICIIGVIRWIWQLTEKVCAYLHFTYSSHNALGILLSLYFSHQVYQFYHCSFFTCFEGLLCLYRFKLIFASKPICTGFLCFHSHCSPYLLKGIEPKWKIFLTKNLSRLFHIYTIVYSLKIIFQEMIATNKEIRYMEKYQIKKTKLSWQQK